MIKQAARLAAGVMPESVRARLARYRFGYSGSAAEIPLTRETGVNGEFRVTVSGGPAFVLTPGFEPDFMDHFVDVGNSRDEMAGFLAISRNSPPEAVLLDIGANRGLFSLVHLTTGRGHRAVLLDPSPPLCRDAAELLRFNGVDGRAEILVAGASDVSGTRRIVTDGLGFARGAASDAAAVDVPFLTVDELCAARALVPSIIKIDVEGAEGEVLRGAVETLRAHRPALSLELHLDILEQSGEPIGALLAGLSRIGYRFETPTGKPLAEWRLARSLKAITRIVAR